MKQENRVKFFIDVPEWIQYMEKVDFFCGSRFHGTVAALLAGVPSVLCAFDARTRELAEYHKIASMFPNDPLVEKNMEDLLGNKDILAFQRQHEKNLLHYIDFLNRNSLPSIFDTAVHYPIGSSPMEQKRKISARYYQTLDCYASTNRFTQFRRTMEYYVYHSARNWVNRTIQSHFEG